MVIQSPCHPTLAELMRGDLASALPRYHRVPGRKPLLVFNQPLDFWYKSAPPPSAYWTRHFDIRTTPDIGSTRKHLPADLSHVAYLGDNIAALQGWNVAAVNPRRLMRHLDYGRAAKTPYELLCMREASRLGALGPIAASRAKAAWLVAYRD